MPPGQAPAIVRFVSAGVPGLEGAPAPGARILGALLRGCLEGLRVEATTAPVLATALAALVREALGPLLRRQLALVGPVSFTPVSLAALGSGACPRLRDIITLPAATRGHMCLPYGRCQAKALCSRWSWRRCCASTSWRHHCMPPALRCSPRLRRCQGALQTSPPSWQRPPALLRHTSWRWAAGQRLPSTCPTCWLSVRLAVRQGTARHGKVSQVILQRILLLVRLSQEPGGCILTGICRGHDDAPSCFTHAGDVGEEWAPLLLAVWRCLLQHLATLHARLLSLAFSCPLHGAEGGAHTPVAQDTAPSPGRQPLDGVEGETALAAASVADALVRAIEQCARQGPEATAAACSVDAQTLTLVLRSALLVLAHASAQHHGRLLRTLLRCGVQQLPQPEQQQGKGNMEEGGLLEACACSREHLSGAELYELAQLDAEWPCAVASLLLEQLRAAQQAQQGPAGGAVEAHDPKPRKLKGRVPGKAGAHGREAAWEDAAGVLQRFAGESAEQRGYNGLEASVSNALPSTARGKLSAGGDISAAERRVAVSTAIEEPLRQVERLFSTLAAIHPAYFAARGASAAALAQCALAAEAMLGLMQCSTAGADGISGAQQGAAARQAALALQAAHRFLGQLSRAGGAPVMATLTADGAAALDWLFGVSAALAADQPAASPDDAGGHAGAGREPDGHHPEGRGVVAVAAVCMLYTSRSIARSVAAHGLSAGTPAPDQALAESAATAADTTEPASHAATPALPLSLLRRALGQLAPSQARSRHGQQQPAGSGVAAAQLAAVAGAVAAAAGASSEQRSKAASGIVAGSIPVLGAAHCKLTLPGRGSPPLQAVHDAPPCPV